MDYLKIANSMPMWIAAGGAVALILIMATVFGMKSYKTGKEIGITDDQMKKAMKSASITSIGPSIVILSTMLTLLITVGGPVAWMRLSFIGAVMFESMTAGFGTQAVGVELGSAAMNGEALAAAVWTMVLASGGSCVIVGRLANHILKDFENTFHVFIGADMEAKCSRVMKRDGISKEAAEKQILKVEKERANHCAYFTHEQWGNAKHYDLMVKSNLLGISGTVEMIEKVLNHMQKKAV